MLRSKLPVTLALLGTLLSSSTGFADDLDGEDGTERVVHTDILGGASSANGSPQSPQGGPIKETNTFVAAQRVNTDVGDSSYVDRSIRLSLGKSPYVPSARSQVGLNLAVDKVGLIRAGQSFGGGCTPAFGYQTQVGVSGGQVSGMYGHIGPAAGLTCDSFKNEKNDYRILSHILAYATGGLTAGSAVASRQIEHGGELVARAGGSVKQTLVAPRGAWSLSAEMGAQREWTTERDAVDYRGSLSTVISGSSVYDPLKSGSRKKAGLLIGVEGRLRKEKLSGQGSPRTDSYLGGTVGVAY